VNTCGANVGNYAYNSDRVVIANSESYKNTNKGCDGDGFDLDGSVTNSMIVWDYSHDNKQEAFLFYQSGTWGPNWVIGSISINDKLGGGYPFAWTGSNSTARGYVVNNTFISSAMWMGIPNWGGTGAPAGAMIANNLDYSFNGQFIDDEGTTTHPTYRNNGYWTTRSLWWRYGSPGYTTLGTWIAAAGETGAILANPLFAGSPSLTAPVCNNTTTGPQACKSTLGVYALQSGSPMHGAGGAPTALPPGFSYDRDFFGSPTNGVWSIGAAN
jgi:hypothetical protein